MMYNPDDPSTPAQDMSACAWCGQAKARHQQMEADGETHHRWSATRQGGMTAVETNTPGSRRQETGDGLPPIIVAPCPDIRLRQLLLVKGLITQAEYDGLG